MGQGINKLIKTFGPKIGAGELQKLQNKFGDAGVARAQSYAKNTKGVQLGSSGKAYINSQSAANTNNDGINSDGTNNDVTNTNTTSPEGYEDYYTSLFAQELKLEGIRGESNQAVARIEGELANEKQRLYNEGWLGSTALTADATKYVSDREKEAILGKADIETQGRLDLQAIINTGLKDVATIEGQTSRDVATIGGEFGVKQEQTRQAGQKDIANIGARAGILQGLVGAFNF
jgi:hypothetical protein